MRNKILLALSAAVVAALAAYVILTALGLVNSIPKGSPQTDSAAAISTATATVSATNTATATATEAVSTVGSLSPAEFSQRLEAANAKLPTFEQIQKLSAEQVHRTPKIVVDAGLELGDIAEAIEKNPALTPQGLEFYDQCAKRSGVAEAVRATCLASLRDLAHSTGQRVNEKGIPANIRNLATKLRE